MPVQAHALPWASLAGLFEYRPAKSGIPGDQRPGLYPRKYEKQAQVIRHFAATFKDVLQGHTRILRAKLKSPEQYKARASSWQHSDLGPGEGISATRESARELSHDDEAWVVVDETSQERSRRAVEDSRALRRRIRAMGNAWDDEQEARAIFSDEFQATYEPYREKYRGAMTEFQTLESWSRPELAPSLQNTEQDKFSRDFTAWKNERTRSDILKLLIIDIARQEDSWECMADIDTLMLLKYHPQVNLNQYVGIHLWCCNMLCGIASLEEFALQFLLYFGILETRIDSGEDRFLSPVGDMICLRRLVYKLTSTHEYLAETAPFKMSWSTREYPDEDWTARRTITTDLLGAERAQLKQMFKWQWKILVLANTIFSEDGAETDWEFKNLRALDDVFRSNLLNREAWER